MSATGISKKKFLIIGGTGTLGETMVNHFYSEHNIIILSRDESKHLMMKIKYPLVQFIVGDMRDLQSIKMAIIQTDPNIIIINGALKHIDICERNIKECLETNIIGVQNVVTTALELSPKNLDKVIFISTDKACNPVSVYGMSKAISERVFAEASIKSKSHCIFVCVRLVNLLNSSGSLIPKFVEIGNSETKNEFQVTDADMTRFFMTLEECINLIKIAIQYGQSGETWIPVMHSFRIMDIAKFFSNKYGKPIKIVGVRPGEKIHEILVNETEISRTEHKVIDGQGFYIIKPCYKNYNYTDLKQSFTSIQCANFSQLESILCKLMPK